MLLLLLGAAAQAAPRPPLRLCYEDVPQPPWTLPDGSGLNLELLRKVEQMTGEHFIVVSRPWVRCLEETRHGNMDGLIGAADTPERRRFSTPPLGADGGPDPGKALHLTRIHLFLRVGSGAAWDGKVLINPSGRVVTQRGYFIGDMMRSQGQRVNDSIKSADEALRLLAAGSADVAALMEHSTQSMLRDDPRFRRRIVMAPIPYTEMPLYLLIGHASYQRDPQRIEAIWRAIAATRASSSYRKREAALTRRQRD
jgi:polar amino acid transport system substrate-binding protein